MDEQEIEIIDELLKGLNITPDQAYYNHQKKLLTSIYKRDPQDIRRIKKEATARRISLIDKLKQGQGMDGREKYRINQIIKSEDIDLKIADELLQKGIETNETGSEEEKGAASLSMIRDCFTLDL